MTDSLGTILSGSWKYFTAHIRPILIASIIFGVLMFGLQKVLEVQTTGNIEKHFGDIEQMQELAERIEDGDEEAFQEMMDQMGMVGEEGELDEKALAGLASGMMGNMMPMFGLFFITMMLLTLVTSTFYIVLALESSQSAMTVFKKVPALLLPMLGVWIWSFLRSFAWIPVVGIVPAIIIGPRLTLSSVILVKEKKGVFESVKASYTRTGGYWGKIVGNGIVGALVVMLAVLVLSLGIGIVGSVSMTGAAIAGAILQSATTAYATIFIVGLSNTIIANPKASATSK